MSKSDDDILVRELGKVGELGGLFGQGGSFGARFAAKFLPTEICTEKFRLNVPPEKALEVGFAVLTKLGQLQSEEDEQPLHPFLKAVIGSGFLNLNPAVVCLEILEGDATGCEVAITAAAKEGLIKQHSAAKAVKRVLTELRGMAKEA